MNILHAKSNLTTCLPSLVKVFLHHINRSNETIEIVNERDQGNARAINKSKMDIKKNKQLMEKAESVNRYDVMLYELAIKKFCGVVRLYDHLWKELLVLGQEKNVKCT